MKTPCFLPLLAALVALNSLSASGAQPKSKDAAVAAKSRDAAAATKTTQADSGHQASQTAFTLPDEASYPRSVFEDLLPPKDPFFPKTHRNDEQIVVPIKPGPATDFSSLLVLNGISGSTNDRLAIINGHTFAAGEASEVKLKSAKGGKVRVKCIEIRDGSVIVSVENQSNNLELRLRN